MANKNKPNTNTNTNATETTNKTIEEQFGLTPEKAAEVKKYEVGPGTGFRTEDAIRLVNLSQGIRDCQNKAGSLARELSGYLTEIFDKKLWKMADKTFEAFCLTNFDIARSTASEAVNTFKRFKASDGYNISEKYDNVPWRTLLAIRNLTDDEITRLKVLECKTSTDAKARVKAYKELKDKLAPDWDNELFEAMWLESQKEKEKAKLDDITRKAEEKDKAENASKVTVTESDSDSPDGFTPAEEETPFSEEKKAREIFIGLLPYINGGNLDLSGVMEEVKNAIRENAVEIENGTVEIVITR